jgi:hypothetical protein
VFKDLLGAVPGAAYKRSSKNHDLSACLNHLSELQHVRITNEQGVATSLAGDSSFPVSSKIHVEPKLRKSARRYIRGFMRELYSSEFDPNDPRLESIIPIVYDFLSTTYLQEWTQLLNVLLQSSTLKITARNAFLNEMAGSTEYFILLNSLWEISLVGDDDEGFRREMLESIHWSVRDVNETTLQNCVDKLVKHGIFEDVPHDDIKEEPHYRLARRHIQSFNAHAEKLVHFRARLRSKIETAIQAEAPN